MAAQTLSQLHASGMGTTQSYELINRLVDNQAFMLSANDIFYVSAVIFLGLISPGLACAPDTRRRRRRRASGAH